MDFHAGSCADWDAAAAGERAPRRTPQQLWQQQAGQSSSAVATLLNGWQTCISLVLCCLQELSSFLALQKDEELVIDNSPEGDLLKISFNIR